MMQVLMRIEAPHYTAGIIFKDGRAIRSAPIIKWMIGKEWNWVVAYINSKRFNYQWLAIPA